MLTKNITLLLYVAHAFMALELCQIFGVIALYHFRRWLINLLQERKCQILETKQFIQDELDLALLCAEKYPDNYVTWNQRCWLVDYFMFDKALWLEKELTSMQDWLWTHVSDHCVYHFRQYLLGKLTVFWQVSPFLSFYENRGATC